MSDSFLTLVHAVYVSPAENSVFDKLTMLRLSVIPWALWMVNAQDSMRGYWVLVSGLFNPRARAHWKLYLKTMSQNWVATGFHGKLFSLR